MAKKKAQLLCYFCGEEKPSKTLRLKKDNICSCGNNKTKQKAAKRRLIAKFKKTANR